jgi:uncharacterized protein (UPF0261 family)
MRKVIPVADSVGAKLAHRRGRDITGMAVNLVYRSEGASFLLELLRYAGRRLQIRDGEVVRIHAIRGGVEIDATGSTFSHAADTAFARAMRSHKASARHNDE